MTCRAIRRSAKSMRPATEEEIKTFLSALSDEHKETFSRICNTHRLLNDNLAYHFRVADDAREQAEERLRHVMWVFTAPADEPHDARHGMREQMRQDVFASAAAWEAHHKKWAAGGGV